MRKKMMLGNPTVNSDRSGQCMEGVWPCKGFVSEVNFTSSISKMQFAE